MAQLNKPIQEPPYYTLDALLFHGIFRYFSRGGEAVMVRGKIHESQERYSLNKTELEIEPVSCPRGVRTYIHCKPYVHVPDIRLTIGLYNQPRSTGAIGEVLSSSEKPRMREIEIGQVQAWYYPDGLLVIWECFLEGHFRDMPLLPDENMKSLWTGVENFLISHFPEATKIVTPFDEPLFDRSEY